MTEIRCFAAIPEKNKKDKYILSIMKKIKRRVKRNIENGRPINVSAG